ncbi:PilZ domain-containing protein [Pseudenhygromyxa sp. WMMC2535]|uniref:PilZ domain-containing protein n=1 Tax=Pseudenhygromyxa sp. WMMC2535 TaxID=2712867 RepID=UPI001556E64D|nr:PilZ domain-containing protein [Pseudenhygromyxa sp. WMMC2535]NVB41406.1 PilZ domain-containing protein [Pseudenhygromyxa sp. WMMC2535]
MRKIRSHYATPEDFAAAVRDENALEVFTTDGYDPGEEVLLELSFTGLPGKMMVRAIGQEWHAARPRLRVRAGGTVMCAGTEWRKIQFLRKVATGDVKLTARRRHVRLPVLVEIRWRLRGERDFETAALSEISEGGALLLTQSGPSVGDEVIIEITPPGSARPLEILAVVRNADNPEGVGLEFMARDMGGVHRLREVIRRLVEQ